MFSFLKYLISAVFECISVDKTSFLIKKNEFVNSLIDSFVHLLTRSFIDDIRTRNMTMTRLHGFRSVVVITSALHAEGRRFKPGRKQFFLIIFLFFH